MSLILPTSIYKDFTALKFTKAERNHALMFLDVLMSKSYKGSKMIDNQVEISKLYFRKVFPSDYLTWLNKLKASGVIVASDSYSNFEGNIFSKSYGINKKYTTVPMSDNMEILQDCVSVEYTVRHEFLSPKEKRCYDRAVQDLSRLKVDKHSLYGIIFDKIQTTKIEDFTLDEDIEREYINVSFGSLSTKTYRMSKEKAISKSKEEGKSLIQDDDRFYIESKDTFVNRKKTAILQAYQHSVNKMLNKEFYGKRNFTNNRLDTNLTNMPKILVNEICKQNNLVQFDLCNSQFAILSHVLEDSLHTEDFLNFKKYSYGGKLYEYIMETLNIDNRLKAKKMMFALMFSKESLDTDLKEDLRKVFPSVVEVVDNYKKENGYNNFSIMLQKKESEIFIDGLWESIKEKGFFCTPKHDSIIVKESAAQRVEDMILKYFKEINFKGKIIRE